ncbi:MAG: PepSY-like domain-containing protein [Spirosomataceae bacterium]
MNKLFLIPVGMLATALLSCEADQTLVSPVSNTNTLQQQEASTSADDAYSSDDRKLLITELPTSIQTYISTQYPSAQFIYAEAETKNGTIYEYDVALIDAGQLKEITFSSTGIFKKVSLKNKSNEKYVSAESITNGAIGQDLAQRFPGYLFIYAKQEIEDDYAYQLVTKVTFRYNQTELEAYYSQENKLLHLDIEGNSEESYFTSLSTLPATIQNYIQTTFAGATFVKAEAEGINGEIMLYEVKIQTASEEISILFDGAGQWISQRQKKTYTQSGNSSKYVSLSELPATVQSHLTTNYAGFTFLKAEVSRKNGQIAYYEVDIRFNGQEWEIKYSATGQFISAKQD